MTRAHLKSLIKFSVAVALIGYLFWRGHLDPDLFAKLLAPMPLLVGFSLVGITVLLQSWRWRLLLICRGFSTTFQESTQLFLIGTFFNYALPGSIGGDVVKAYYIAQDHPARRVDAVLTVVLDRLLGLYAMVVMALFTIGINWDRVQDNLQLRGLALGTLLIFLLMSTFWAAAFSSRVSRSLELEKWLARLPFREKLLALFKATQAYGQQKRALLNVLVLSALAQVISTFFMVYVGMITGHADIPLSTYFFAVPLGFIASSLPVAPAGLGVGQVAFLLLFNLYLGRPTSLGQVAITAFQMILLGWGLVGALFYLRRGPSRMNLETS